MVPSGRCTKPASRWMPPAKRRGPIARTSDPRARPAPRRGSGRGPTRRRRDHEVGQVEDEHRRVGDDRDLVAFQRAEDRQTAPAAVAAARRRGRSRRTAAGDGARPAGAPRRRGSRAAPCSPAPRRRCRGRPSPVPGSTSRRRPASRHEDRAGEPDIEPTRAQLAVGPGLEAAAGGTAERHDPADRPAGGADHDRRSRPDLADDAGERGSPAARTSRRRRPAIGHASRTRIRRPGRSWPAGAAASARALGAAADELDQAWVAEPLGDRCPDHDRVAGRDERSVARCERKTRHRRCPRPARRARTSPTLAGPVTGRPRPQRRLPADRRSRAAVGPIGQAQRDVAKVDEQSAQSAGHIDREMTAARPEADGVAEAELGDGLLARRRGRRARARQGQVERARLRPAMDDERAGRSTGAQPGRGDDSAQRGEQVVREVGEDRARSPGSGMEPERAQQPCVVECELARPPADG